MAYKITTLKSVRITTSDKEEDRWRSRSERKMTRDVTEGAGSRKAIRNFSQTRTPGSTTRSKKNNKNNNENNENNC